MSDLVPFGVTGSICQKSPQPTSVRPLKGLSALFSFLSHSIFLKVLSNASKHNLFTIGASSQIISEVLFKSLASLLPCFISQVVSEVTSNGIWNRECVVLPFGNYKAAIPKVPTGRTIIDCDRRYEIIVFHSKVLPVPPCPWMNINLPSSFHTDVMIVS